MKETRTSPPSISLCKKIEFQPISQTNSLGSQYTTAPREVGLHRGMDAHAPSPTSSDKSLEIDSVASFVDHVNKTVGKHFRCCICFSILEDPVMLPCNHSLCRGCAMQSMRQRRRCPQCLADIPNLRTLQGRNKWITSMVDSLRNCLNEVGVNLTQHAPVPAKYLNARPPPPRERPRARSRGRASVDLSTRSPSSPVSCGGGTRGATVEDGGASSARRPERGTGAKRKRSTPLRPFEVGEGTARAPPSRRTRETAGQRAVRSESNAPRPQPRAGGDDHVGGLVAQESEGNLVQAPSLSSNAPFQSPPPRPFAVGDLVSVDHRSWPGMNKQGGVGFVCAVLGPPGSLYDIKYSLSRKVERGIDARFVHPYAFLDDTLGSRSRRGTGGRETRRASSSVGSADKKASGPDLTRERTAAHSDAMKSDVADNAVLTANSSRKPSPFRNAGERGHAPAAGVQTEKKRNATNGMESREEKVNNETRESSATVQRNESDTALAVTSGVGRVDSDDARLGRGRNAVEGRGRTKPTECEKGRSNGADESDNSDVTFIAASGEGRCDSSKARVGQGCDACRGNDNRPREEVPLERNESGRADLGSDSDTTLIIEGGREEGESSDDAEVRPHEGGVGADDSPDENMAKEGVDEEVTEWRRLAGKVGRRSRDDNGQEENPGLNRVGAAEARKSESVGDEPRHRETAADRHHQAQQNSPSRPLVSGVQYDKRGRRSEAPLSTRASSETETFAEIAEVKKCVSSAQGGADPLSPIRYPAPKNPVSASSAGSSTRKFEGSPSREKRAQDTSEDASRLGLPSEVGKKHLATFQELNTPSSVSSAHGTPDRSSQRPRASSERTPRQVMPSPAPFTSPSQSLKTPSYKVGDFVDVLSRTSPGVNKEGGVARVTRVNVDGTYDVKYCVRHGAEKAVEAAIMSPYVVDGEGSAASASGEGEGNRKVQRQLPVPSPSTLGVSVRRTNRRGSCPPDAAVGQANAACLNLILGDTQHPELALDPDLIENLSPIEGDALADPARQEQEEVVPETGDSGCVTDSISVVLGKEKVVGKRGRPPRGATKRKNDGSRQRISKKKPKVGEGRTREGRRARHLASRENGSVAASGSGAEGTSFSSRLGQARPMVLTLSSLTPEMIAVAEALSCSHGWRVVPKYTEDVTHVVCGTAPRTNKANIRSAKFLRAVASGKWVVNEGWLLECQLRGEHVKEEAFEISGDRKSTVPSAPRRSRLAHAEPDRPGLFHGTTFHLRGHFGKDSPPLSELEAMLLANGGTLMRSMSDLFAQQAGGGGGRGENRCGRRDDRGSSSSGSWRPPRVVIFQPSVDSPEGDIQALSRDLAVHWMGPTSSGSEKGGRGGSAKRQGGEVEIVKALWLVDSIGSYRVLQPTVVHRVNLPNANASLRA